MYVVLGHISLNLIGNWVLPTNLKELRENFVHRFIFKYAALSDALYGMLNVTCNYFRL
jgi:hypothetical protein